MYNPFMDPFVILGVVGLVAVGLLAVVNKNLGIAGLVAVGLVAFAILWMFIKFW